MTVLYGLAAALLWGLTDVFARLGGRRIGPLRALFWTQSTGLLGMGIWLAADPRTVLGPAVDAGVGIWLLGIVNGPFILCATGLLYRALTVGTLAIVSPVAASYGAVTALIAGLAGEAIAAVAIAGIVLAVAGVALASSPGRAHRRTAQPLAGVGLAAGAALIYGVGIWLQGVFVVPALGPLVPVFLYYATGVVAIAAVALVRRQSLAPPARAHAALVWPTGICSSFAYLSFSLGLASGEVAVVTVLSSLASGIAAFLGFAVLKERLAPHQWAGIAAIVAGIALINGGR